jgi:hypothetical protein
MSYIDEIKSWFGRTGLPRSDGPRIVVIGDSHTAALKRAREFGERSRAYGRIEVVRIRKEKGKKELGDVDFGAFCEMIRGFGEDEFVFSAMGGNQYAVVSTVQNPIDFDYLAGPADTAVAKDAQVVPRRAIAGYIDAGVRGTDGPVLREIRKATRAKVFHLLPPPPKQDNGFISQYFESRFAVEGMEKLGPSRPELRLKTWNLQADCLEQLCCEVDIQLVRPPAEAVTADGFLAENCYAKDATHGNRRYGEMVLKQILDIAGVPFSEEQADG